MDSSNARFYVTGYTINASGWAAMALWRYTLDGRPDTAIGTNGMVTHSGAAGAAFSDAGSGIVNANGTIVVVGQGGNAAGNTDMVLWGFVP